MSTSQKPIGVIRGRFQVPKLHKGHIFLFEYAFARHDDVLAVLSDPYISNSADALSIVMQMQMIQSAFPGRKIHFAQSGRIPSSRLMRSRALDEVIERAFPGRDAIIYGSRESIVHSYVGRFATHETETIYGGSGTQIRNAIEIVDSEDFRKGVIYSAVHRRGVGYPAADVVVTRLDQGKILLIGWEEEGGKLRFPGSFHQQGLDASIEATALRCIAKEVPGIRIIDPRLVASHVIDDYRHKRSQDGTLSTLVSATYVGGEASVGSGIDSVHWIPYTEVLPLLVDAHKPLGEIMKKRAWA